MNTLVHSANVKYAVIQVSSESDSPGQLVLAYPDEQSLRNLIAEPSIIACEFSRPEEAAALVAGNFTKSIAPGRTEQNQRGIDCRRGNYRRVAYSAVQFAFASAVLVLFSKNIVSSLIRTILGI